MSFSITKLSALFRDMASNHNADFHLFLNCLLLFRSEEKRNFHDNVCKNNKHCQTIMPNDKHSLTRLSS